MGKLQAFTLLEVMVALMIIAITMGAIVTSGGSSAAKASYLKEKTVANWVAQNQIAMHRAKRIWPGSSNSNGKVEMAGVEWLWTMKISKTDDPLLRRIDVDVFLRDKDNLRTSATAFIGQL